jgi:arylsulfatase A-like enzyme
VERVIWLELWRREKLAARSMFVLALMLVYCSSCGPDLADSRPNLLLITVDALRADHMSLYGYERATTPELERWLSKGRIYERAYSVEANTSPSIATMFTGVLPQRHGVRLLFQQLDPSIEMLPDHLRRSGYHTAGVVSNIVLTDEAMGIASHFDHYDDFVDEGKKGWEAFERRASRTTDSALTWLVEIQHSEGPHFLWVHYIDPHGPYDPPPEAQTRFSHEQVTPIDAERVSEAHRRSGVTDGLEYVDRYDGEIAHVDAEIGRLLREYERLGFADGSVVLFTADHGETMMEFERWFTHGYQVYEPIIRVPLALIGPGIEPARESRPVSLVSVMPTLLDLAGLEIPDGLDGASLASAPPDVPVFAEASTDLGLWRAAIFGDDKWVVHVSQDGNIERRHTYPIDREASQNQAPWDSASPAAGQLLDLVERDPDLGGVPRHLVPGMRLKAPKVAPGVREEMLQRLKALGYVDE